MSPRPGRISAIIDVPFERPRTLSLQTSVEFNRIVEEVRTTLGEH
jgi:NitT/TauT family transport system ATP-binding protein